MQRVLSLIFARTKRELGEKEESKEETEQKHLKYRDFKRSSPVRLFGRRLVEQVSLEKRQVSPQEPKKTSELQKDKVRLKKKMEYFYNELSKHKKQENVEFYDEIETTVQKSKLSPKSQLIEQRI